MEPIDPTKGTLFIQVENISIYSLIKSTAKATVDTSLLKASSVTGPDFGTTKTFKLTKMAACVLLFLRLFGENKKLPQSGLINSVG